MDQFQENVNFNDYIRVIKSRKSIILIFFFVVVFIVTLGSFLMTPVYRATAMLLIDVESPQVLTTTGTVALGRADYYAYKEYFQSQRKVIKSRGITKQVFDEFKLVESKDYKRAKDPIKKFLRTISVEAVRDTRLILLNVDSKDPKLAADIANRIAEIYVERNLAYITKSEVMNLLKNEYLKLQTKFSEYSKTYKHQHPKIIRLKQEIEQMATRIEGEKSRAEKYDIAKLPLSTDNPNSSDYALASLKANNITIQDRAEPPIIPLKPKKRLNVLLAVVIGLFGGTGLAFFTEYLEDTVKGAEDIERLVKWPFLGNIPKINGKGKGSERERDLFVKKKPKDPVSEAYRSVRTSIMFSSTEEHPLKSIVITSPGPQEGKTTTLSNLGIAIADSQKKVLLVDADMRKPRLHQVFENKNDIGLSSFLSGQASFEDLIKKTKIDNISFVSGGLHSPNPSELISSHKMKEFIDKAKERFDFIIFDTPPIAVVTDAVILSKVVDGTIIVLESDKTGKRVLPRIDRMLSDAKARIIGIILNKISHMHGGYYYYSQYYAEHQK